MKTFKIYDNVLHKFLTVHVGHKDYEKVYMDEYFSYVYSQEDILDYYKEEKYKNKNLSIFACIISTIHTMQEEKYKP